MNTALGVRRAVEAVPDPELRVVTIGELGIVRGVRIAADGIAEVDLTPTYTGCPAIEAIAAEVAEALAVIGQPDARVRRVLSPAWTTDWITAVGRRKLLENGIAPPTGGQEVRGPVSIDLAARCPRCGSTKTTLLSRFGPTPCQSLRTCTACGEPFGQVKPL